jgi:nitroreductase
MDFFDAVEQRRTVRDFENAEIDDQVLEKILSAGLKAPSNDHMRDWQFIVIKDRQIVMELLDIIPKGISEEDMEALIRDWNLNDSVQQECYRDAVPKQYKMLADASAVIIPLFKQKTNILAPENISHLNGLASIWCCIENIFLAATAEGYACNLRIPLGSEGEWTQKVLGYPDDYVIPCFIGIGKPRQSVKKIVQKEIRIQDRIHKNKW